MIYDNDTYPVILGGKILWVRDAFTWSHRYPYSKPVATEDKTLVHFNGVNYIRNSVKATVDAYDGKMAFYIVDDKDPGADVEQDLPWTFPSRQGDVQRALGAHALS